MRKSTAARLKEFWVRIPPGAWMFVCCECCEVSGRGLCDGLITLQKLIFSISLATLEIRRIPLYLLVPYHAHLHLHGGRYVQVTSCNFVSIKYPLPQILTNDPNCSFMFLHQRPFAFLSSSYMLHASPIPFCFI